MDRYYDEHALTEEMLKRKDDRDDFLRNNKPAVVGKDLQMRDSYQFPLNS